MENFLENCPPSKIIRNHDKCTKSTFLRTCVTYFKLDLFWRLLFSGLCCEPQPPPPPPPHTHTPIIAHINTEKPCFSSAHEAVGPANDVRCWVSTSVEAQFDLSDLLVNSSEHWMELNTNYWRFSTAWYGTVRYGTVHFWGVFHWVLYLVPDTFLVPLRSRFHRAVPLPKRDV